MSPSLTAQRAQFDSARPYVTTDLVRPILEAEGVPPERLAVLTNGLVSVCGSVDDVRALIVLAKTRIPELFVRPAPMPAVEAGLLRAADRFPATSHTPEVRGAQARRAERAVVEDALMARLSQLVTEAN